MLTLQNNTVWTFTPITEADINTILEIESDSFKTPWNHLSFLNELSCKDACSYAAKWRDAKGDKQLIGYICFRLTTGEMHILKIAVAPQWRGRGVATGLMEKSIAVASKKDISKAFLEVRPANYPAINFYRKIGFQIVGKRKNYYIETNEDALVMMKKL